MSQISNLEEHEKILNHALTYFNEKNYKKALQFFKCAEEVGSNKAIYYLGLCYHYGYGVDQSLLVAFETWYFAANLGIPEAMYNIGMYYFDGNELIERNREKAFEWFQKAADLGYYEALFKLSYYYRYGVHCKINIIKANELYEMGETYKFFKEKIFDE